MVSRKFVVALGSAVAAAFVFSAAPSLFARGSRASPENPGGDMSGAGQNGSGGVPIGGFTSGSNPTDTGPGSINFGADGAAQKEITGDVLTHQASDDFRRLRDLRNRRTADPDPTSR